MVEDAEAELAWRGQQSETVGRAKGFGPLTHKPLAGRICTSSPSSRDRQLRYCGEPKPLRLFIFDRYPVPGKRGATTFTRNKRNCLRGGGRHMYIQISIEMLLIL